MDGDFGIQTGASQGNTLWISLPLAGEGLAQNNADLDGPLQGTRLLIVDDNDTCRKVLVQQCSGWGLDVSAVASGKEALALLRTKAHLKEYFDVVLLDQDMPGMTGMQLASKIRRTQPLNHDILLIMLTGMSSAPARSSPATPGSSASWPNRWPATPSRPLWPTNSRNARQAASTGQAPQRSPASAGGPQ